jgi:hypothetical protein
MQEQMADPNQSVTFGAGRRSPANEAGGVTGELAGNAAKASGVFGEGIEQVMMASMGPDYPGPR